MSRTFIVTPCPAPYTLSSIPIAVPDRRESLVSNSSQFDDTADIEYTRAIRQEFKDAKPRRKSTFQRKDRRDAAAITIFEDVHEDPELVLDDKREQGGSTLFARPAQRIPGRAVPRKQDVETQEQPLQPIGQARRRTSIAEDSAGQRHGVNQRRSAQVRRRMGDDMRKDARRRTIFVPTDDTTILTIHPGAHTTDRLDDTFHVPHLAVQPPVLLPGAAFSEQPTEQNKSRRPRMSLAVAPKRLPLQHVALNDNLSVVDVPGRNGGKENVPPNAANQMEDKKVAKPSGDVIKPTEVRSRLFEPTAASQARKTVVARNPVPLPQAAKQRQREPCPSEHNASVVLREAQEIKKLNGVRDNQTQHQVDAMLQMSMQKGLSVKTQRLSPRSQVGAFEAKTARLMKYPVLSEDLPQPELYEERWLNHQEIALTEVINEIFRKADSAQLRHSTDTSLRERLIQIYHQPGVACLYKRLQASLQFGALSRSKDMPDPPSPANDIGLRKRFLGMWLDSYDEDTLQAAAEVIIGRSLPRESSSAASGFGAIESIMDPSRSRRALIGFLETFLVEVADVENTNEERADDHNGRWRKMILRSLMLIWLLDQAYASRTVHGCLFEPASPHKTSAAMLRTLAVMLIPSIGDILKTLRHLDLDVSYVQDPLDEICYHVDNIAVDLRDGVLLNRLVEVLLFSPTNLRNANNAEDATLTIQMPDLTMLESPLFNPFGGECPRVLSQHLKIPCLGRAQKLFNVQVALSALHDHGRLAGNSLDITADDIVNSHREKTLSLLWSLVAHYGLEQLVDFHELATDVKRIASTTIDGPSPSTKTIYFSHEQQENLLQAWATAHCTSQGFRVANLTTSFADGKAYVAILDAFKECIEDRPQSRSGPLSTCERLEARLQAFGCSSAFSKQLSSGRNVIANRQTTTANLAFLASRLLPLARRRNAALTIQRAFTTRRSRVVATQRVQLMRLAHACAAVVQTEDKLITAATVLQRSWRNVLDVRIARLNRDIVKFQAAARGWMSKRRKPDCPGTSTSQAPRILGGW